MTRRDVLKEIVRKKKEKILLAKQQAAEEDLKAKCQSMAPAKPFTEAIKKPRVISLIAEIKRQSPSEGVIRQAADPAEIARLYREAGAQAISVLTEEDYFGGSLADVDQVRAAVDLPVLRKDFILEPYQVYETRAHGADALLLIASLLSKDNLAELMGLAQSLGLACLVEVHSEKELKKALSLKVPLIGINNRDLHTLEVDTKTTERLFPLIPRDKAVVVESGIKTRQDVMFLKILGVNAVLIGTALMQADDIARKLDELMG